METLSIDRELNKKHFYGKSCRKCAPKADPFSILLNNPKKPLHVRNFFKNGYFESRLSKSLIKVNFIFSFEPSPF